LAQTFDTFPVAPSGPEELLDPRAQKPPRSPQPTRRNDPSPRQVVHRRDRHPQQLGDLSRGHHLLARQPRRIRASGPGGSLSVKRQIVAVHAREDPARAGTSQPRPVTSCRTSC